MMRKVEKNGWWNPEASPRDSSAHAIDVCGSRAAVATKVEPRGTGHEKTRREEEEEEDEEDEDEDEEGHHEGHPPHPPAPESSRRKDKKGSAALWRFCVEFLCTYG